MIPSRRRRRTRSALRRCPLYEGRQGSVRLASRPSVWPPSRAVRGILAALERCGPLVAGRVCLPARRRCASGHLPQRAAAGRGTDHAGFAAPGWERLAFPEVRPVCDRDRPPPARVAVKAIAAGGDRRPAARRRGAVVTEARSTPVEGGGGGPRRPAAERRGRRRHARYASAKGPPLLRHR